MSRASLLAGAVWAALAVVASCHRAEIDLTPLLGETTLGGAPDAGAGGAGREASTVAGGEGGAAGATACDDASPTQDACMLFGAPPAACEQKNLASDGWAGCVAGCTVCAGSAHAFPYYFNWHPCCEARVCASGPTQLCSAYCPAPTAHDKRRPCVLNRPL